MTKLKTLLDNIIEALNDAKALDINIFEVSELTNIADYMIIASGRSNRQVSAIAEKVTQQAKENGITPLGEEGRKQGEWVLVDLGDIIVHIMHPETREYYQLEKLWQDTEKKLERK